MKRERIISEIRRYQKLYLKKPNRFNSELVFSQRSYQYWAVDEIVNELKRRPDEDPVKVMENFIKRMERYSLVDKKTSFTFSVAKDMAEVIEDLIISLEGRNVYQ